MISEKNTFCLITTVFEHTCRHLTMFAFIKLCGRLAVYGAAGYSLYTIGHKHGREEFSRLQSQPGSGRRL